MPKSSDYQTCPRCGIGTLRSEIPSPHDIDTSRGCWAAFSEVLSREYSDPERMAFHHLTVDTYMAQHPASEITVASITRMNTHVLALYLNREFGFDLVRLRKVRADISAKSRRYGAWITPPGSLSRVSWVPVLEAQDALQHGERVDTWASAVWREWSQRRVEVAKLATAYGF